MFGKKVYFCSYIVIKNDNVFACGDFSFGGRVGNKESIIEDVRDKIKDLYYRDVEVTIILTALNEI